MRLSALAVVLLTLAAAACGTSDTGSGPPTCASGMTVCGSICCTQDQTCNTATGTCSAKCAPACQGKVCGPDGCGGSCGSCADGSCDGSGQCVPNCSPSCGSRKCGDDGCGGSCGSCQQGESCQSGQCAPCQPTCGAKKCGDNGCGGSCGTCATGTVCDATGACVECLGDQDCTASANGPKCDTANHACVGCLANADCNPNGSVECDPATHRCKVGCKNDNDCSTAPGTPKCHPAGVCVACLAPSDCTTGAAPLCDSSSSTCVQCIGDTDCTATGAGVACKSGKCVACTTDPQCGPGKHCTAGFTCAECTGDVDCTGNPNGAKCDLSRNVCVGCTSSTDCAGNADKKTCDTAAGVCVFCLGDANCTSLAPACDTSTKTCVECTTNTHCASKAGTTKCQTATHSCVECLGNGDCASGTCSGGKCSTVTTNNDTCATPAVLDLSTGSKTVSGDLTNMVADIQGSCGGGGSGRDVVYKFTTTAVKDVTATVTASTTGMRPVVYVATDCAVTQEKACNAGSGATATVSLSELPAGTYYLWVDATQGFPQGQFSLTVTATTPPARVNGDLCSNAIPLSFNSSGNATVTGTLNGAKADYTSFTCAAGSGGNELVYSFTTTTTSTTSNQFSASVVSLNGAFAPTLVLQKACPSASSGDEPRCTTASSTTASASLTHSSLPPGTYWLVVDNAGTATGSFDLSVKIPLPPVTQPGDNCSNVIPLTLTNNAVTVSGTTVGAANDAASNVDSGTGQPLCGGGSAPDVVYSFTTTTTGAIQVNLKNKTSTWTPSIYLRAASCGTVTAEKGCNYARTGTTAVAGADTLLLEESMPAGTYYLWVDGYTSGAGAFDLTVHTNVPTFGNGGESCSAPVTLTLTEGLAIGHGTLTSTSTDDRTSSCVTGGKDVVYAFTLPSGYSKLQLYVGWEKSTQWDPALILTRGSTCSGATTVGCNASQIFVQDGYAVYTVTNPVADTYYLWVEGTSSTSYGPYYFEVWAK